MYIVDKTLFISNKEYINTSYIDKVLNYFKSNKINRILLKSIRSKKLYTYRIIHIHTDMDYKILDNLCKLYTFDFTNDKSAISYCNIKSYYSDINESYL